MDKFNEAFIVPVKTAWKHNRNAVILAAVVGAVLGGLLVALIF